ncbi:MAG: aminopeptidase P family protein [Alphaproteobacteria bacterium]|nr:aminopeptidase P family protein [Alphaproteobacteria bacterium]
MTRKTPPAARMPERLAALRREMARLNLDGFVIPRGDEHQNEYVPPAAERLRWLTGFSGSAGWAVVTSKTAMLFVDGRYTLQAKQEVDSRLFALDPRSAMTPWAWLKENARPKARIGFDPWLLSETQLMHLRAALRRKGGEAVALPRNPIDVSWRDRPPQPAAIATVHPPRFAGTPSAMKRAAITAELRADGADSLVLTQPDSIAWLLNVRGNDVPYAPFLLAFAILRGNGNVDLFTDPKKIPPAVRRHLGRAVRVREPDAFGPALDALGKAGRRVRVCPDTAAAWIFDRLARTKAALARGPDPCQAAKAAKTEAELAGIRRAHRRDGVALARFLAWLAREAPKGRVTELAAAEKIDSLRAEAGEFREPSFPTISGAGANGAVVHYRVGPDGGRRLKPGDLYLVDSGGQYPDGTTDVTRTVAVGKPTAEMRERFTRVLKGHIALARAVFPAGTSGRQLDALARQHLWRAGLDYDHGTGHGVGHFLSVHEGPQRIAKAGNAVPLRPGMVVSNEPGYYKTGAFGIRIENLLAVRRAKPPRGAERTLLDFEVLTLAPIDRALVEPRLLDGDETAWLDAYHGAVRRAIGPRLKGADRAWFFRATRPLGRKNPSRRGRR